jgi:hypothetical protein
MRSNAPPPEQTVLSGARTPGRRNEWSHVACNGDRGKGFAERRNAEPSAIRHRCAEAAVRSPKACSSATSPGQVTRTTREPIRVGGGFDACHLRVEVQSHVGSHLYSAAINRSRRRR